MSEFSFSEPSGANIRVGFGCHVVLVGLKVSNGPSLSLLLPIGEFVASLKPCAMDPASQSFY